MAGKIFTFLVLKILTAILHVAPPLTEIYDSIIIPKRQKCNTKIPKPSNLKNNIDFFYSSCYTSVK